MRNTAKSGLLSAVELRRRAEEKLIIQSPEKQQSKQEHATQRLLHELQVHQIELEIQNAELKLSRDNLETLLEKYTSLYDFAPVGYVTLDCDGVIIDVNLAGASLTGGVRSRLIGRSLLHFIDVADRHIFKDFLAAVLSSQIKETCEVALLNEAKKTTFVQIEAMATASGKEFRLAMIDITGRKNLETQLQQAQKMEIVSLLAEGVAHNFNNILNVIVGYASLSEMKLKTGDPLRDNLTQIILSADRGVNLTRSLLDFSSKQAVNRRPVDINEIIRNAEPLLKMTIGENIQLEITCTTKALMVNADSNQLEQVFISLASNAMHAMPEGGKLSIFSESVDIDSEFMRLRNIGELGKYALISVTDVGTGMNRQTVLRIFEPFFTTQLIGKGTGLGLSIVYNIVKQHNGFIEVKSAPDKGTTLRIFLPLINTKE
ncbi:MAG: ATP-binding protein [Deltaproteobacteria bacterium]|nr:ATP-binding protein [Deltaproteobacteria bacterium]